MQWLTSTTSTTPEAVKAAVWPPMTQSYAEYKQELDEAIEQCPPFREWLTVYRNVNHICIPESSTPTTTRVYDSMPNAMWHLTVPELKEMYAKHLVTTKRARNAKRSFAEMNLELKRDEYEKLEAEYAEQRQAYTTAREAYDMAKKHGYQQYSSEPKEPEYPYGLRMRDCLIEAKRAMSSHECQ